METKNKQHVRSNDGQRAAGKTPVKRDVVAVNEVAPGVPIVRSSTPKPLSFGPNPAPSVSSTFPSKAPVSSSLPEELEESDDTGHTTSGAVPAMPAIPLSSRPRPMLEETQEFIWLFEYGLEMDPVLLNSPDRLNGVAMLYGPALLKGYRLAFGRGPSSDKQEGQLLPTIVPSSDPQAEVWGVLYRIPRRLSDHTEDKPSLLDAIHAITTPADLFEPMQLVVRERYRDRDITVTAYVATAALQQHLVSVSGKLGGDDTLFMQRMLATAQKQRLPESYVETSLPAVTTVSSAAASPKKPRDEKDTDPLLVWHEQTSSLPTLPQMVSVSVPASQGNSLLTAFAAYLLLTLLGVLLFAILQAGGLGHSALAQTFMPLGVPWLVLVYGLLGGCMSCLIGLGRVRLYNPPAFLVITWCTRPYIGLILAMLAYLLLNSGLFSLVGNAQQHMTWFLLVGGLAGMCEGWLFFRKK